MAVPRVMYIDREMLLEHVRGCCKRNLKKPCKICLKCPFIKEVMRIMDTKGWEYHKDIKKNPVLK